MKRFSYTINLTEEEFKALWNIMGDEETGSEAIGRLLKEAYEKEKENG